MDIDAALLSFSLTTTVWVAASWFLRRQSTVGPTIGSAVLLCAVIAAISLANPGANAVAQWANQLLHWERAVCVSTAVGMLLGFLGGSAITLSKDKVSRMLRSVSYAFCLVLLCLLATKDVISKWLPDYSATGSHQGIIQQQVAPGFIVEVFAELEMAPTSMTIGDNHQLYVAGYGGLAFQNGKIIRLNMDQQGVHTTTDVICRYLNRPHGLAYHKGALFVSRSGQFTQARNGKLEQANTGCVTKLEDLDGDGTFEFCHDVISGLPGAQLPDGLHQNNGITFDHEGRIYVTVGAPSDHGPALHRYAGTILRSNSDGKQLEVFAKGLRNPFGITSGPYGQIYCTDNDANLRDMLDKVLLIRQGEHYGHPYDTTKKVVIKGVQEPLLKLSSAQGIIYAPKGTMPDGYDDCLYVASYGDDRVNRINIVKTGGSYTAKLDFFAAVPNVVALAIDKTGVIYACGHHDKKIYRIRPAR